MDSSTYYDTYSTDGVDVALSTGALLAIFFGMFLISIAVYALMSYFLSLIFKKAGVEQWKAWVPVYNGWVMLQLGGQPGWWIVLSFVPIINIAAGIFSYIAMYNIGLKLHKSGAFLLLAIFLSPVWTIILGVDSSTWDDSLGAPRLDGTTQQPATTEPKAPVAEVEADAPVTQKAPRK